jgi:hypothetical protein
VTQRCMWKCLQFKYSTAFQPPWLDHSNYTWRRVQVMKLLTMPSQQRVINIFWDVLPCTSNFRVELMPKIPSKYWYPSTRVWWCYYPEHNQNLYCHKNFTLTPMSEGEGQGWFHKPSHPQILVLDKKNYTKHFTWRHSRRPKYEIKRRIVFIF